MNKLIKQLKDDKGISQLIELGGDIYLVGGCVRDHYLGLTNSKDIDIIVRLIDTKTICNTLNNYGRVDTVGESFGVIKYSPNNWVGEPIDIALPRKDVLFDTSLGHHGIKAEFDKNLSIEEDLERRDCTINSVAVSLLDSSVIDPFNGLKDINNKIIKATSIKSFIEDPLRLLRVIQFASRFNFSISYETLSLIEKYNKDIKRISGERIIDELDKIYFKGDIKYGLKLLYETGLYHYIFGINTPKFTLLDKVLSRGDFYYCICGSELFKEVLKGDNKTLKNIEAIEYLYLVDDNNKIPINQLIFNAIQISDNILYSGLIIELGYININQFKNGKYPKNIKELNISGDQLIELGYKGIEIGKIQKHLLTQVLNDKINNNTEELILAI